MDARTLLFTDVVDSTKVVQRLGDAAAAALWAEHDFLARALLAEHGGLEIDRSDGFLLLFDDVASAARFAVGYHAAVAGLQLAARVGIHYGPVTLRQNPAEAVTRGAKPIEVEGLAKPLAARVMALATGGQTLLSGDAALVLQSTLPTGHQLRSHGHYRLKGIDGPLALFELGDARCAFLPPADADKAYRVVSDGDLWRPAREIRHNLAPERDTFVGRTAELRELAAGLENGSRLVSVLGVGGTGKTRLVRRYARAWLGDWPGGVYFCDLSEARTLEGICFAVANALEVTLGKADPVIQLGHAIAGRGRCLVVLDNFEQIVAHAGGTLGHWLDRAAEAAFVVTSRERLQVAGEMVFPIEPLAPDTGAIELFDVRARAQLATFVLNDVTRGPVEQIVRLLDGLPLAIELAAARVRVLSPHQILQRLNDRFMLLGGTRGAAARQATLRAAIDWSWELLGPWEQAALAQCSVFEGGFTLEAAEAVLDLSAWPETPPAMDVVQALVDKSLVRTWHRMTPSRLAIAEPYFGMYLSVHEFASQRLRASGEDAVVAAQRRHGTYFGAFGTDKAVESLAMHGGVERRRALALEIDNLVAAQDRALTRGDWRIAAQCLAAAWSVLYSRGPHRLGVSLSEPLLRAPSLELEWRVRALLVRASALWVVGRFAEADELLEQVLGEAQTIGDDVSLAHARHKLGIVCNRTNRPDEASQHLDIALSLSRKCGLRALEGSVLAALAHTSLLRHDPAQTLRLFELALSVHREVGNTESAGVELSNLAAIQIDHGQPRQARENLRLAVALLRESEARVAGAVALANLAQLTTHYGTCAEAMSQNRDALAIVVESGSRVFVGPLQSNLGDLERVQGNLDAAEQHLRAGLASAREIGDRRDEAGTLAMLGDTLRGAGRCEEARELFEQAVSMASENDDERTQGKALARLAVLDARQGHTSECRERLQRSEQLLRECGDTMELALMLCEAADAAEVMQDSRGARDALTEAERLAAELGVSPESELARRIANLKAGEAQGVRPASRLGS